MKDILTIAFWLAVSGIVMAIVTMIAIGVYLVVLEENKEKQ